MIKAFLSHSSIDKGKYVKTVADKLGVNYCVYDEYTFEAGMRPLEEILRGLDTSQLFVVFISESALQSQWVQTEVLQAHKRLEEGLLQRIFPIIIDSNITHSDTRIPQWMQEQYNLKYVGKPTVAARRIRQRLIEISWEKHPNMAERQNLFVGRFELLKIFEERLDDFSKVKPNCIIASGLPRVGRSTLLRHGLIKVTYIQSSYELPSIVLRREESIEDLLLKLFDLGFSDMPHPTNLMDLTMEERVDMVAGIVRDIQKVKEVILVHDDGCLVNYTRGLQPWFDDICQKTSGENITFLLASRYRPSPENIRHKDYLFALEVPELSFPERCRLLKRLLELNGLGLTQTDFTYFANLQYGLPDQVQYTCDLIKDLGVKEAKNQSHLIADFNSDKASIYLTKYEQNLKILDFLYLLSEFEYISFSVLYSLVPPEEFQECVNEFIASAVCDFVGVEKEYIRLNDTIRDFVRRNRIGIPKQYKEKLRLHLENFLNDATTEDRDVSDYAYSIREAIKSGKQPPEKYLIPSYFLVSMRELYQERGHADRVIELADKLLSKPHLLDSTVADNIRYYLCLSLARKRNPRLLEEVQHIHGPEHNFILGFYYRLQGRAQEAIDRLTECLDYPMVSNRAKRELVQVYKSLEDFESAASMARANYEENRGNAYHVQAYFDSLINSRYPNNHRKLLQHLIKELDSIKSDLANEMMLIACAEFEAKCNNHYQAALDQLKVASSKYPASHYPLVTKGYLAAREGDLETLRNARTELERLSIEKTTLVRLDAYIYCLSGNLEKAIEYVEKNLKGYPPHARDSFIGRLEQMAAKQS